MLEGLHFDEDWDEWKSGDWIVWNIDGEPGEPVQITRIDEYSRVFWMENGQEVHTRATNMVRVKREMETC